MCLNRGPECPTPYAGEGGTRNVVAALICVFSYCASVLAGHPESGCGPTPAPRCYHPGCC